MPDNKRQHYVPKSTLRHFACDAAQRQINIINVTGGKVIRNASLKDQCYGDYFYGKATDLEKALSEIEGTAAALVKKMIASESIDLMDSFNIATMIALQKARTLRAEEEMNSMADKAMKLMMINRIDEEALRKVSVKMNGAVNYNVGLTLAHSPIILDLKQFLLVNRSNVPFIIADNPVVTTNWFGRSRLRGRASTGIACAGLQMVMPLAPQYALLFHDSNVYTTDCPNNVLAINSDQSAAKLNELQWLNAHKNVYFPSTLGDEQILSISKVSRGDDSLSTIQRHDSTSKNGLYRATDKDEYAGPNDGITSELVHFRYSVLPKDIHIRKIGIRANPRFHDDGSMLGPTRDPAWCQIVEAFADALESGECSFLGLWEFAERHPLASQVGSWLNRFVKGAVRTSANR